MKNFHRIFLVFIAAALLAPAAWGAVFWDIVRTNVDREMRDAGYTLYEDLPSQAVYTRPLPGSLEESLVVYSHPDLRVTIFFQDMRQWVRLRAKVEVVTDQGRLDLGRSREAREVYAMLDRVKRRLAQRKVEPPLSSTANFSSGNSQNLHAIQ